MSLQQDQLAQITREVGDPNGTVAPIVGILWSLYAARANVDAGLVYLYAKRAALDVRLAEEQPATDLALGTDINDHRSQRFGHLQEMRVSTQTEIERIEMRASARRVPQSGALTKTAPESPPFPNMPDANWPGVAGSPYWDRSRDGW